MGAGSVLAAIKRCNDAPKRIRHGHLSAILGMTMGIGLWLGAKAAGHQFTPLALGVIGGIGYWLFYWIVGWLRSQISPSR
jgi:hypothetical protein